MKQQDLQAAYHRYCDCIAAWNDSPLFWRKFGVLYFKNDQMTDAVVAFQRTLYLKTEIFEAWANLGLIFEMQGDTEQAMKIYESGLESCPGTKQLRDRPSVLAAGRGRGLQPLVLEINESKYFVQIAERIANEYLLNPPAIPAETIGGDGELAACLAQLVLGHRSIF
jgi:tetratricopeptide (TPR) repeat protein